MNDITKLRVGDEDFLVASMIERCPKTMMIRELVKNALEAVGRSATSDRRVEITALPVDGVNKLRIWNTGPGLDAEELFRMCDIASSINKLQRLDANFGMGAKVATLPSNHLGVRYRSCAGGHVHEVVIGKRNGVYGRVLRHDPLTGTAAAVLDVTAEVAGAGQPTDIDWTEVVLLGNRAEQDTVTDPYDGNPRSPRSWVLRDLQQRFFRIAGDVRVLVGPEIHGGKGLLPFVTLGSHMAQRFARQEAVVLQDGIVVRYGYDPEHAELANHNASYVDRMSPDVSFAGLVHDDEFYDFRTGLKWTQEAPSFGISFGARHLSVVVELPAGYPVRSEGYRQFLRYLNGRQDQVRLNDFAGMVRNSRPEWVRDVVRSLAPDLDLIGSVQEQLQKLIASLGLKRLRPMMRRPPAVAAALPLAKGVAAPVPPPPPTKAAAGKSDVPPPRNAPVPPPSAKASGEVEGLPVGMIEDMEALPEIFLLRSESEIADRNLAHRAARFYADTHELYVNMRYPSVVRLADLLFESAPGEIAAETTREAARTVAEHMLVLRLGRTLIYGLSKRAADKGWSDAEKQSALSSELLTVVADDLHLTVAEARDHFAQRLARVEMGVERDEQVV